MAVKYKIPSQASSGLETFADAIVGLQITNGTNQLTNSNFNLDRAIPEKDDKNFRSEPFSDFLTLDDINEVEYENITSISDQTNRQTNRQTNNQIKFKNSKNNGSLSLYGSLKNKLGVAVSNIIKKYPAGVYIDGANDNSVFDINYDNITDTTTFKIKNTFLTNPLDIIFLKPQSQIIPENYNEMRYFFSSYEKYVIEINSNTFDIIYYEEPITNDDMIFRVIGNCFSGNTVTNMPVLIRPNNGYVEEFFKNLDDIESILLNRETTVKYTASFVTYNDDNEPITEYVTWPISYDGWNILVYGFNYDLYISKLSEIGEKIDVIKSNLITRYYTSPQIFEFDTIDKKIESIFQIYGQSFDNVKKYIDNIQYMRKITYDGINNLPDPLLKNLVETLGLTVIKLYEESSLNDIEYNKLSSSYSGLSNGLNLIETETEMYRRLLNNLSYLLKSKGSRKSIEFLLKFFGAPDQMIIIDEFIYNVNGVLPTNNFEEDINEVITNGKKVYVATINNTGDTSYMVTGITNYSTLFRDQYPVDEKTGLPRKFTTNNESVFFEMGAGWNKKTLDHRSSEILDTYHSDLNSRIKTIKTMSKPFTYGEDYFNLYRTLPGLNYGYNINLKIDNDKTLNVENDSDEKILNTKKLNVFLSADNIINYDIFRKINEVITNGVTSIEGFIILTLDDFIITPLSYNINNPKLENMTFDEFKKEYLNIFLSNINVIKYENKYNELSSVNLNYNNTTTPYIFDKVYDYIRKISPNWIDIVEQFIPATTLWLGGNIIQNNIFQRTKYVHKINRTENKQNYII